MVCHSSSKTVQGLEPTDTEHCDLKLCLSNKFKFVGPLNEENINEKIGIVCQIIFMIFICYLDSCVSFLKLLSFNIVNIKLFKFNIYFRF